MRLVAGGAADARLLAAVAADPQWSFTTAVFYSVGPDLELRVGTEFRATKALRLIAAVSRGFTDGSVDWGVSA